MSITITTSHHIALHYVTYACHSHSHIPHLLNTTFPWCMLCVFFVSFRVCGFCLRSSLVCIIFIFVMEHRHFILFLLLSFITCTCAGGAASVSKSTTHNTNNHKIQGTTHTDNEMKCLSNCLSVCGKTATLRADSYDVAINIDRDVHACNWCLVREWLMPDVECWSWYMC